MVTFTNKGFGYKKSSKRKKTNINYIFKTLGRGNYKTIIYSGTSHTFSTFG